MIELPLVLLGGLLGSSHCIGMCGGFAITIGLGSRRLSSHVVRQLVYSSGRVFTYAFLGALAGYVGLRLAGRVASLVPIQAALSILAGVLLVFQGLHSAGWFRLGRMISAGKPGCLAHTFFGSYLTAPGLHNVFVAGLMTGFLPCGLVYGYLALAASTQSVAGGMAVMAAFGLGTIPLMALTGIGAGVVGQSVRRHLWRLAACAVIVTGLLSVSRGVWFASQSLSDDPTRCPNCPPVVMSFEPMRLFR